MKIPLLLRSLGIGAISGLRTTAGPATAFHGGSWTRILPLLVVSELVVDKLPSTPSRTAPPLLAARFVSGAASGAAVSLEGGGSRWAGAALGAAGAIGASYLGAAYRRIAKERNISPLLAALAEDAVAIGLGLAIARRPAS